MKRAWISCLLLCSCQPPLNLQPSQTSSTPVPALPSAQPSPIFSPVFSPSPVPTSAPTSTPLPESSLIQVDQNLALERDFIFGRVYDGQGRELKDVKVTLKSLNQFVPYDSESITQENGAFTFSYVPLGIQVEITAFKPGHALRRNYYFTYSTRGGGLRDPIYFGFYNPVQIEAMGLELRALNDEPEVAQTIPLHMAHSVNPSEPIVLKFSEPMDRESVENNFEIRTKNNTKLGIDTRPNTHTLNAPVGILPGDNIWDQQAFEIRWNADSTEASFYFKPGYALPSDKVNPPAYSILFTRQDGHLKDQAGTARSTLHFKRNVPPFANSLDFTVAADTIAPRLLGLQTNTGSNGARLTLTFSESMQLPTRTLTLAGGLGGNWQSAPAALSNHITGQQAAANYLVSHQRNGQMLHNRKPWSELSGQAHSDPEHSDQILLTNGNLDLRSGDQISIEVANTVVDPAGNLIDPNARQQTARFGLL